MPPPDTPFGDGDELPVNPLPLIESVPWLYMPAPPVDPVLLRRPLVTVNESSDRLPELATSKIRKVGVPAAADRMIVAPLPATVTVPVITGSPVPPPPSVELLGAV